MAKHDDEERDLLESFEREEWRSVADKQQKLKHYRQYADATFKKDRRVNIRISSRDLDALRKRALEEGIPYQTLIASILHKFAAGTLTDKNNNS